jgi:hypothetical protein
MNWPATSLSVELLPLTRFHSGNNFLSRTGQTRGANILDARIAAEEWDKLLQNIQEFESLFISKFQDATLCAAFVFQFQPINQHLGNLLVHAVRSHIGKASPGVVLKLEEVVEICEKHNLCVVARSFDGDNSYHGYHVEISKRAREMMPRFEQICKERSDPERLDEENDAVGGEEELLSKNRDRERPVFGQSTGDCASRGTRMTHDLLE